MDLHGLRVLIVDDNATNRMILEGWVSGGGMKPTATADGPAAIRVLWRGLASNGRMGAEGRVDEASQPHQNLNRAVQGLRSALNNLTIEQLRDRAHTP